VLLAREEAHWGGLGPHWNLPCSAYAEPVVALASLTILAVQIKIGHDPFIR
jgi:hypothetical protein